MGIQLQAACFTPVRHDRSLAPSVPTPVRRESPLLAIAPGPTRIIQSSTALGWRGLLLEKHASSPGERVSARIDRHVISMVVGSPSRFEHRSVAGFFVSNVNRPGTITITPSGPVPDLRLHTASEFIHCTLSEEFTRRVTEELDRTPFTPPIFRPGVQDKSIQRLLGLLLEELDTEKPSGRLYVDSLAHALATRYLLLDCAPGLKSEQSVSPLPTRILNRVQEKIEANLDTDLSLDDLARESGYSRSHFLRMFRAATGETPHQYVLGLRLRRAQECLRQKEASIIEVAMSCGFASQSHMTSVFRQRLEMTPAEFRRKGY